MEVGEMGQIIGKTGVVEMGVCELGVILLVVRKLAYNAQTVISPSFDMLAKLFCNYSDYHMTTLLFSR